MTTEQKEHMMTHAEERADRISQLVALCVMNNKTPHGCAFADFIVLVCFRRFNYGKRMARLHRSPTRLMAL